MWYYGWCLPNIWYSFWHGSYHHICSSLQVNVTVNSPSLSLSPKTPSLSQSQPKCCKMFEPPHAQSCMYCLWIYCMVLDMAWFTLMYMVIFVGTIHVSFILASLCLCQIEQKYFKMFQIRSDHVWDAEGAVLLCFERKFHIGTK